MKKLTPTVLEGVAKWQQCPSLLSVNWRQFKLVSFDIFDTLLHRAVAKPTAVFIEVGNRALADGLISEGFSADAFAMQRIALEKLAREHRKQATGSGEVTLSEIWEQAPSHIPAQRLMQLELEVEYSLSLANPYTVSLINELHRSDGQICLASDTYFPRHFIQRLLTKAGVCDAGKLTMLLSCEHRSNKQNGELFAVLLRNYMSLKPEQIIHVGDDLVADSIKAEQYGLRSQYLSDIHLPQELAQRFTVLGADRGLRPLVTPARLGHLVCPSADAGDGSFFHYLGSSVLGPILAAFALWLVDDAKQRGITLLCPLMREALIFEPLIKHACQLIDAKIDVRPVHSSRRTAFVAAMQRLDQKAISHYRLRRNFTLSDLIAELDLPQTTGNLANQLNKSLSAIENQSQLNDFLTSEPVQSRAAEASEKMNELTSEYLGDVTAGHQKIAFIDLGARGNPGAWLAGTVSVQQRASLHNYLFYALTEVVDHLARGHKYSVFLPFDYQQLPKLRCINRSNEPLEVLLTGQGGTTLGYYRDEQGRVQPLLAEIVSDGQQQLELQAFQNGVMQAYEHLAHCCRYTAISNFLTDESRQQALDIVYRLIELPTSTEARQLGRLLFDDNAGSSTVAKISSDAEQQEVGQLGAEGYMAVARQCWGYQATGWRWPQGTITQLRSETLLNQHCRVFNDTEHQFLCRSLVLQLKTAGFKQATVYGAGKLGHMMVQEARGQGIDIQNIVDSDCALYGLQVDGVAVVGLDQVVHPKANVFLVASAAFAVEIESTIRDYFQRLAQPVHIFALTKMYRIRCEG